MTTLIIARHGNTFGPDDTPTRVGAGTDIALVEKGREQAIAIGKYLKQNNMIPDVIYSSSLQRTKETAALAIKEIGIKNHTYALDIFNEIDYGPDENMVEADVIARIGVGAIKAWDESGTVPDGWNVDPKQIIENWNGFAKQITSHDDDIGHDETVLVVTSNGVARFAPYLTGDFESFKQNHTIKLSTGALGILKYIDNRWHVAEWNIRP